MHYRGWKSVYCIQQATFKGSAPLLQVLRWTLGSDEIFLGHRCRLGYGYGGKLKYLERLASTINIVYPFPFTHLFADCKISAMGF
uniref:Cellulose synthase A catalytic subunit 4 [UDP-forming] n=1 Tax=Cajanus cajan TaxID=3821 RepID=A0A151TRF7_CAJCA|nr:Cellulose synthase A catalytic subunit 4 [UDP-forming] [Cajanus cajan]